MMPEHHLLNANKNVADKSRYLLFEAYSMIYGMMVVTWLNTA